MYFVIPGESVDDPLILNKMQVVGLDVIRAPSSSNFPYWYEFVIKGDSAVYKLLESHLKDGWYAAAFTKENIDIIFKNKHFSVIKDNRLTTQAAAATEYGSERGVQRKYLNWRERQSVYLKKLNQAIKAGVV